METKETLKPGRTGGADAARWPSSKREGAQKKKGPGGRNRGKFPGEGFSLGRG